MVECDNVIVTCAECGIQFEIPRWMFEVDLEEEISEWFCTTCSGDYLEFTTETQGVLDA